MAETTRNRMQMLSRVAELYTKSLETHGAVPMGVGWKSEEQQRLRFKQLVQLIDSLETDAVSVNDWGCGYGAMFPYLLEVLGARLRQYRGYDISESMLATARTQVVDSRAAFVHSPLVTDMADYSFVSGTFNVKLDASDEAWTAYVKDMLVNLAEKSRRGFAFNVFSTYVDWRQDTLYYADPFMFFDFCKRRLSKYVSLLHDYPLYEWTMIVRTAH